MDGAGRVWPFSLPADFFTVTQRLKPLRRRAFPVANPCVSDAPDTFSDFPTLPKSRGASCQTPRMAEGYRVADAARVLGVSPKRVRQLIQEGRLPVVEGSSPMAVEVEAVHRERERRKSRPASTPGPQPTPAAVAVSVEDLLAYAERITARALDAAMADRRAADAARDQAEDLLRASLAEATQRAEAAEAEAQELRERLASKPWKRKGKGKGKRKG